MAIVMDCFGFTPEVEEHSGNVTIVLPTDPGPTLVMLPSVRAEELIGRLGLVRAVLEPAVSAAIPAGPMEAPIDPPRFTIGPDELIRGNVVLSVRDVRFGWLHYWLDRAGALELAALIKEKAELRHPSPAGSN